VGGIGGEQVERTLLCAAALTQHCVSEATVRTGASVDDALAILGDTGVPALLDAVAAAARPFPGVGEVCEWSLLLLFARCAVRFLWG
jgi:hypothetical protein